jgi:CDP-glucose 4,6-dehydratase
VEFRQSPVEELVDAEFWKGKTAFVTGHTGFKGGWLSLWLQALGAKVTGYALAPATDPSLFTLARVAEGMTSIIGDVRDAARLEDALASERPQIVFHMAAQALVRPSYAHPVETYATNVMGTAHVLEAVRKVQGVRAVVSVTSDKCYENREWVWGYRENESMGGYDPYSSSKGCAELVTAAYRSSFFPPADHARHGVAVASARAGNVIGGGDWAQDRLVPDFVRAIVRGEAMPVRNPGAVRPWQHVLEPVHGYLMLAQKLWSDGPRYSEAWNFGPDDESARNVETVVTTLAAQWGGGARWRLETAGGQPHEANYLKLDCSKAKTRLNWHPRWRLEAALAATAAWYKAWSAGADMRAFTLEQIRGYAPQAQRTALEAASKT